MISGICPSCATPWRLETSFQSRGRIRCIGCRRLLKYTVLGPGAAAEQTELYMPPAEAPPTAARSRRRPRQSATKFVLFLIGGALILSVTSGIVLRYQQGEGSPAKVQRSDPYAPDCRIVRDHLRSRYGEGVEVISWGRRTVVNNAEFGSHAFLSVSFRTSRGARTIRANFTIGPDMTVESMTYSD